MPFRKHWLMCFPYLEAHHKCTFSGTELNYLKWLVCLSNKRHLQLQTVHRGMIHTKSINNMQHKMSPFTTKL